MPMNSLFSLFHYNLSGSVCLLYFCFCFSYSSSYVSFGRMNKYICVETCHIENYREFFNWRKALPIPFYCFCRHSFFFFILHLQTFNISMHFLSFLNLMFYLFQQKMLCFCWRLIIDLFRDLCILLTKSRFIDWFQLIAKTNKQIH